MAQAAIQTNFSSGEWAPQLNARVDLAKYHAGAATVRNFFVDYRGGVSTCPGSKYLLQAFKSSSAVRLIRFQASTTTGYVLEFGDLYIRFANNGGYILEAPATITGATRANPCVVTVANTYAVGDWVYISNVVGMTQLNGNYYRVNARNATTITLGNILDNSNLDSTAYTAYASGGIVQRVYTLVSPYTAAELAAVKFVQNVNTMILCHPNHPPQLLTLVSATSWTIAAITFGSTIGPPTIASVVVSGGTGVTNYLYCATSVDPSGQESLQSAVFGLNGADISSTSKGSIAVNLAASISGALFYKFYKTAQNYAGVVPNGPAFGYIGYSYSLNFIDNNIQPDFSITPPISGSAFQNGGNVISVTVGGSAPGAFAVIPNVAFGAPPTGGTTATGYAVMSASSASINTGGTLYKVGDIVSCSNGVKLKVATVTTTLQGTVTSLSVDTPGILTGAGAGLALTASPTGGSGSGLTVNIAYLLAQIVLTYAGSLYTAPPSVLGIAPASAGTQINPIISTGGAGANPFQSATIPQFFQQRLTLAAPPGAPQSFYMSQPGLPYDFNISNPIQPDNAISGSIVSGTLSTITAMVPMSNGLIMFTQAGAFLINGGTPGSEVTPIDITANPQSYAGSSDIQPIVVNYDILYVQAKGSIIRDLTFNYYLSNYVGTDITLYSSHLFYGHTIKEWCYAEEPFKLVWAVREDGILLCLTYMKEQEIVGWSHRDTTGTYKSVTTVTEQVTLSNGTPIIVDAVYVVVSRVIGGNTVQYIERFAERIFPNGVVDAWFVDAGVQYTGSATSSFTGGQHLGGQTVVGLADGVAITPFTMPTNGIFTLPAPASKVTIGLAYTPQLQTLRLDLGEPTVQGKRKKITGVTLRVQETLGLSIGKTFTTLVPMKDLVVGNVGTQSNSVVTGLVTDDARTIIDPSWSVDGEYCIEQDNPYPATVLGVIPEIVMGDK